MVIPIKAFSIWAILSRSSSSRLLKSSLASDSDRLVKLGRSLSGLTKMVNAGETAEENLNHFHSHIVDRFDILLLEDWKVPKVRFGKTELQIPIVSLGCARFQQTWERNLSDINDVDDEVQRNLFNILKHAFLNLGINHIENAGSYGCSELQMGQALKDILL